MMPFMPLNDDGFFTIVHSAVVCCCGAWCLYIHFHKQTWPKIITDNGRYKTFAENYYPSQLSTLKSLILEFDSFLSETNETQP